MSTPGPPSGGPGSITVEGLGFRYGTRSLLTDVSLRVRTGELCCLLGPNGAGKTTLIRCVLGLLTPRCGSITVLGAATTALSARELARRVAYVPQVSATPFPFRTLEVAVMGRTPHLRATAAPSATDRRVAMRELERLGIGHLADRVFTTLSGGERQLAMLARALVQQAPLLVLDEPTAALDYGNETTILAVLAELARSGHGVLMTTHQPAHALAFAQRAVLMREGVVVADGAPDAVLTSESLSALYATPIHVASVTVPGRDTQVRTCLPVPPDDGRDRP